MPDVTVLASVEPDDATNRCRYVASHFGVGVTWMSRDTERVARWDWPPDIWSRSPEDDIMLQPAVQAVMILCEARQGETSCLGGRLGRLRCLPVPRSPPVWDCPGVTAVRPGWLPYWARSGHEWTRGLRDRPSHARSRPSSSGPSARPGCLDSGRCAEIRCRATALLVALLLVQGGLFVPN
jgi:hypothetical protein